MKSKLLKKNEVLDFKDNLFLKRDGSVFAIYEIGAIVANTMSDGEKEKTKNRVASLLNKLSSYGDVSIYVRPKSIDLVKNYENLARRLDRGQVYLDLANTIFNKQYQSIVNSLGEAFEYEFYLVVPLKSIHISVDLKEVLRQSWRNVKRTFLEALEIYETMDESWYEKYKVQKEVLESTLSIVNYRAVTEDENKMLHRSQYLRGLYYEKLDELNAINSSVENLDDVNVLIENVTTLKINDEGKESYVGFYPVGELPKNVSYLHLLEDIQKLSFPVESDILLKYVSTKGYFSIFGQSQRAKRKIATAVNESSEAGDRPSGTQLQDYEMLNNLQDEIDAKRVFVHYLHTLIITADSLEELHDKRDVLMAMLDKVGILKANPDQLYLFYKTRLGEALEFWDKNFVQKMSIKSFCENLLFVSHKVGNDVGFYLGRIDNQVESWFSQFEEALLASSNLIFTDLLQANKLNIKGKITNNPHVAITGDTGSGKSFLMKLLFVLHSLLRAKTLYIDPKNEMKKQFMLVADKLEKAKIFPELVAYIRSINYVTLDPTDDSNQGMLDPIVFLNKTEGMNLARTIVWELFERTDEKRTALNRALEEVYAEKEAGKIRGMLHVFEKLQQSEEENIKKFGEALLTESVGSTLSLVFSYGRKDGISLSKKITILGLKNIQFPKSDANVVNDNEKNGLVVLYAIGYFLKRFGSADEEEETLMVLDEGWMFSQTTTGAAIINEVKRLGRRENNFLVFITQSVNDINNAEDKTSFGTVFAFREEDYIDEILDYVKIPVDEETRLWVDNMTQAQCIYYDAFGRKERITIDGTWFPEMIELFDTVKTKDEEADVSWEVA